MKIVKVVTTKPDAGVVEYGIWDTSASQWVRHGEVVTVSLAGLPAAERNSILATRALMLGLAQTEATKRGIPGTVKVLTTRPETDESFFGVQDPVTGEWRTECVHVPTLFRDLSPSEKTTIQNTKAALLAVATADATTKGYLP